LTTSSRRKPLTLVCSLFLTVATLSLVDGAELRRGPYLQSQRPDGITVRWRTDASVRYTSVLRYGKDFDHLDRALAAEEIDGHYPGVLDWQVKLAGLEPDTAYYYALEADRANLCGADANHCFRTAPASKAPHKLRLWAIGDFGANRPRADSPATVMAAKGPMDPALVRNGFRKFNRGQALDGFILLGDNAYPTGSDEMYQAAFFNVYADELRCTPLWPCTGNHDIDDAYVHLFGASDGGRGLGIPMPSHGNLYYSVDLANLHLVVLDPWKDWLQETSEVDHAPWQRQLAWLKKDLAATDQEWIVVLDHFPVYCDGNYQSDQGPLATLRQCIVPLLDRYGVDAFLSGHDHTYQRSYLLHGFTGKADSFDPARHLKAKGDGRDAPLRKRPGPDSGTLYVVSGTGGGSRPNGSFAHPAMIPFQTPQGTRRGLTVPGSLVLEIDGLVLRGWQVGVDGQVLDHFVLEHESPRECARH